MSGGLIDVSRDYDIEAMRSDLKECIDSFYLQENHQSLVDIVSLSVGLMQKYGVEIR